MKKLTALLLIVISIACIFSGCGNGMEFEDKKAMHDYAKGVWSYLDSYFIFDDEDIYLLKGNYFNKAFDDAFSNAWSTGGKTAFKALTYEEVIKDIKFEDVAFKYNSDKLIYTPLEGKIVDNYTEEPGVFLFEQDGLKYKEGEDDDRESFDKLTKFADEVDLSKLESIKEYFEEEKEDYKFEEKEKKESSTPSQSNSSYNLPTTSELLQIFEKSFTVSNVKHDTNVISFKISTGETIFGITNNTDKVRTVKVHAYGTNMPKLLEEKYHYYPLCHFLTNIKGETVTAAEITEILTSVEPTSKQSNVSISMNYTAKRNNIQYELTATQYSVNNYCTLELSATIL